VYARSTTFATHPAAIDAGVTHVRDQVMPTLLGSEGCIGLSMLVDRRSGRCVVTTAWRTEQAMRASPEQPWPVPDHTTDPPAARPLVEEWEIAVLHRDHTARPGACVRVTWVRIDPAQSDRVVDLYKLVLLPQIQEFDGFCSAALLLDRSSGYAVSSVTFDSHDAMRGTRKLAAVVRERGARQASGEIIEVAEFELVLAHLHVPEMA
jgi:hypothetical protein